MHAVLRLEPNGADAQQNQALEHALPEARALGSLARHDRAELPVVADHHHLLGARDEGDEALGLRRLRGLVHEYRPEPKLRQARVPRPRARRADDVRRLQDVQLQALRQRPVPPLVLGAQLAELVLELLQLGELPVSSPRRAAQRLGLVVQSEVLHGARDALAAPRGDANHPEARLLDLLRELVHRDVRRRAHEHLLPPRVARRQVVHDGRGGHRLARPRRALNQAQGRAQHRPHRAPLAVVQRREVRGVLALGQGRVEERRGDRRVVAEEEMVHVPAHARLVQRERAKRLLRPVERGGLPEEIHAERVVDVRGRGSPALAPQLHPNLLVRGELHHLADGGPRRRRGVVSLLAAASAQSQLVADD